MNAASHRMLGEHLIGLYMKQVSPKNKKAFLLGCMTPDRNPTTYVKGSIRCQWLRGHNWGNARRYISRLCRRLERRKKLRLADYYNLGKLIHYTADGFTYPHNSAFQQGLRAHRRYERQLYWALRSFLRHPQRPMFPALPGIEQTILAHHRLYREHPWGTDTDTRFCYSAVCAVMALVTAKQPARI